MSKPLNGDCAVAGFAIGAILVTVVFCMYNTGYDNGYYEGKRNTANLLVSFCERSMPLDDCLGRLH